MGHGPDVLLLHGLGGTRASLFETAAAMSQRYRVHAPDLPGFGSSSKPARGGYNARWFAEHMLAMMDSAGIERAHVVGNSMGGRIGIEMALIAPERVSALGPAVPGRGLDPPWLSPARAAAAPGVRAASARLRPRARWPASSPP